jgi:hypothetical protein
MFSALQAFAVCSSNPASALSSFPSAWVNGTTITCAKSSNRKRVVIRFDGFPRWYGSILLVFFNVLRTSLWSQAVADRGSQAFAPISQRTDVDSELRRLREEVRVLKMERDILKKAAAFFAKENA